jgi:MarR family transcriptional regulator, organic hydroperoxide resistance regulator
MSGQAALAGDDDGVSPHHGDAASASDFGPEFQFLRALWEIDHALESASRNMKKTFGVTGRERLFIRIVGQRPGITPGEVAGMMHVHPSSVTAVLKRLERRRFVSRRAHAADARSYRLELTPTGERINAMKAGTIEAGVRQALARLSSSEVAAATDILTGVARRLSGSGEERARGR